MNIFHFTDIIVEQPQDLADIKLVIDENSDLGLSSEDTALYTRLLKIGGGDNMMDYNSHQQVLR